MDIFIGRQPIFNTKEQIIAYELLYRSKNTDGASFSADGADGATIDVLINSFLNIGIEEITNGKPCFINFTENLLVSNLADYLNPQQVVVEILENVPVTKQVVQRVKELKEIGFKVALDDFVLDETVEIYNELFAIIDYIKVDFLLSPLEQCIETERIVRERFPHVRLLAEKVETREQFEIAQKSGYVFFQGYFFEKPQLIQSKDLPVNTFRYFEIMTLLKSDDPNIDELSDLIEKDLSLSYKILQLINYFGKNNKSSVHSLKQAIVRIGFIELRKWIYLLAMRGNMNRQNREAYIELMRSALFRAKVCESLAKQTEKVPAAECFLVGMLSLMDTLLQRPMELVVEQLPLTELVVRTIRGEETDMTPYLEFSIALGRMDWSHVEQLAFELEINAKTIKAIYTDAIEWADIACNA